MSDVSASPNDQAAVSKSLSSLSSICQSSTAYLILTVVLCLFALAPLFYPGYIQTHSCFVLLWNVADLRANLGNLAWLPHVATQFDPLRSDGLWPFYLASLLPFEPATAIKGVMELGWLLGSLGMFCWLKKWLGSSGALLAALVYTYMPHQINAVYVRGAWGEAFFLGLLPWAVLVSESLGRRAGQLNRSSTILISVLAVFLWLILGLSQLGLTLWAFIFVVLLCWLTQRRQALWSILANSGGLVLAVMITLSIFASSPQSDASLWDASPPPLSSPTTFSNHFLYPFQLFSAAWGFGSSRPGWNDGLSFQLGLAAVGLTFLTLFLWPRRPGASSNGPGRRLVFLSGAAIVFVLLQFSFTQPLWSLPLFPSYTLASTLTYPWQLLGLAGFCLAVLAGASLWLDEQLARLPLFSSIIILVILSSYPYLLPQFIQIEPELKRGPQAILGADQVALLTHNFTVEINGNTAGLERGPAAIPLVAHGPLQAGEVVRLHVTWQALQTITEDWKVFVHLVDANGQVLAQFDGQPREGAYPTSRWTPGELIKDSYPLLMPATAPLGPYRVFVGFYNEVTGARLPVPGDPEGRVMLNVQ
ncbi:MAG: hypothetical protein BroJett011_78810 [Chloroflexota bacterium]|nr:MAG: hypothetical protein BroJett011_78810 [Chloroflexota bacterium]